VTRLLDAILKSLSEPRTMDDLMVDMLQAFEADPHEAAVYYLIQPTIYAALSHLEQSGQVVNTIRDRRSAWVASS
ncbi:MAG TPA: hypothetical protein VGR16_14950, partial [Thermomicrobiales bacterium]|nr:hypothetical protein [Thermomicrobiales bacterium]